MRQAKPPSQAGIPPAGLASPEPSPTAPTQAAPTPADGLSETANDAAVSPLAPGLYLVSTPIGNLEDITLRALRVLREADCIACEDTRQTQKLLNHYAIRRPTVSCHQHNERECSEQMLHLLRQGGRVAVVSDAGTPGISDPGMVLARAALEAGIRVIPIPGANAALAALVASGFDVSRFLFVGFLPAKAGARQAVLERLSALPEEEEALTMVFYEAPHRIAETLAEVERRWGGSVRVTLARELTKWHEEFLRGTAAEVRAALTARDRIRGEIVLLVEARRPPPEVSRSSISQRVEELMRSEGLERKEALKRAARERGISRSEAYREMQRS